MVTGNEYIFENALEAANYILQIEKSRLNAMRVRQTPPVVCDLSWVTFNQPFNASNFPKIPTDSFDYPFSAFFNNADDDKFIMTRLQSGRCSLKPNLRNRAFLFRGESEFHNPCRPGVFRDSKKKRFLLDFIHGDEMVFLILSHPLVQLLDIGVLLRGRHIRFEMNIYGLTQHYYNSTTLLDLTSDINVALFFATQQYNKITDSYMPIIDENHEPGVLYYYEVDMGNDFQISPTGTQLYTIGLQVFPRSGRQKGYLFDMPKGSDFNAQPQVKAVRFKHKREVAEWIYHKMGHGDKLFPNDALAQHWKNSKRATNIVSTAAVRYNLTRNPNSTMQSLIKELNDGGITVCDYIPLLTNEELHQYYHSVKTEKIWEQFCNQIYIPGDKDGAMMDDLLNVPRNPKYLWAFEEHINSNIDYNNGYLLKRYKNILTKL